jgi:transposase
MPKGTKLDVSAAPFFDMIEKLIREGYSINDAARRLRVTAHSVIRCVKARPELAPIAKENGRKKQIEQKWRLGCPR